MNNYRYEKDGSGYNILEITTGYVVKRVKKADEATKYTVRLNKLKTGFQGNSPQFFAVKPTKVGS